MAENKLAELSTDFAIRILKATNIFSRLWNHSENTLNAIHHIEHGLLYSNKTKSISVKNAEIYHSKYKNGLKIKPFLIYAFSNILARRRAALERFEISRSTSSSVLAVVRI